ncbi:MAG: FAD binding domain-containing protein [Acidobacteriota bacterium]
MRAFEYANPSTKKEVVKILSGAGNEAAVLAGGTDLLSLMKDGVVAPRVVVNIKSVGGMRGIEQLPGGGLTVGALTTIEELLSHPAVKRDYPALIQAAKGIRSPQIRNMGTVGGELCQRPRCWYYRNGFGLLARSEGESMVTRGDNRYHAILGNGGSALFVSPSSLAPPLIALGARLQVYGSGGEREVALRDFYRTPVSEEEREYHLAPDEIVEAVILAAPAGRKNATYEVRQKEALDWPLATAAVALQMTGTAVQDAAVVLGHVAPVPWVSSAAAASLKGKTLTLKVAEEAGRRAVEGARPLSRNAYKVQLARVAVKRALLRAAGTEVKS